MKHLGFVVVAAIFGVAAYAHDAAACSCIAGQPPCAQFWENAAAFSGRVTAIDRVTPGDQFSRRRVVFAVAEAFRGVSTSQVELTTGSGSGDCGYPFAVGESYFVYGYSGPDGLTTGICSRTRKLADAAEDLAYARAIPVTAPLGATITGRVFDAGRNAAQPPAVQYPPLAGVTVLFDCDGKRFSTVTRHDGTFSIRGVPVGSCQARVNGTLEGGTADVVIRDPRGCGVVDLAVKLPAQR